MKFNVKNLLFSGTVGGITGLALTMESQPEIAGVLLGCTLGVVSLYAHSMEAESSD